MTGETPEEIETSRVLNRVCRESMKERLLRDILVDLAVCELEGWDRMEYINEISALLESLKAKEAK